MENGSNGVRSECMGIVHPLSSREGWDVVCTRHQDQCIRYPPLVLTASSTSRAVGISLTLIVESRWWKVSP